MKISVVIPAYNEEQRLPGTLEQITRILFGIACPSEIVVVDNDSQDRMKGKGRMKSFLPVIFCGHARRRNIKGRKALPEFFAVRRRG